MKNIHVLPTDKPSRLIKQTNNKLRLSDIVFRGQVASGITQNIYITSDEEIKEGDFVKIPCGIGKVKELNWKYGNDNPSYIVEDIVNYTLRYGQKEGELQINSFRYEDVKKIILTTDSDLIKDGVQAIDDEFLEWFVKNPSCEWVKVNYDKDVFPYGVKTAKGYGWYKIIIPKEELKTSEEWQKQFPNTKVIDPDGWDRKNYQYSWFEEKITLIEYTSRLHRSTVKGIIPKEEPKQETIEEASERIYPTFKRSTPFGSKFDWTPKREREAFIKGAKWQQERMYSEEDLREAFRQGQDNMEYSEMYGFDSKLTEQEWFENFKKK